MHGLVPGVHHEADRRILAHRPRGAHWHGSCPVLRQLTFSKAAAIAGLVVLLVVLPTRPVGAEPSVAAIKLTPAVGPPTTKVVVKGKGFAPNEGISLSFDQAVIGQSHADGTGKFSSKVHVPSSALPGDHAVTAT